MTAEGFPAQVHITEDYFPLFWQANDDTRNALKRSSDGTFRTKDGLKEFTLQELANLAASEPQRFSPSVVL
ncbi:bacillithiol biosynthesis protein BshC, partial [Vibrio parahaemolyticus]|uniref:bacillithiol biosynthesis protein BshC n=1 Tax=Vibrio parahaemolyticus TaxID=670 RepID=UPI001F5DACC6